MTDFVRMLHDFHFAAEALLRDGFAERVVIHLADGGEMSLDKENLKADDDKRSPS